MARRVDGGAGWRGLVRGLARRCARCGAGRLFHGWFTMVERCPRCGLRFERVEGHWVGAVGMNMIVTELVFGATLVIGAAATWPDPPWWQIGAACVVLSVAVPLAFYPTSKTLWTAIDLGMRPLELAEIADAAAHADGDPGDALAEAEAVAARRARSRRA